MSIKRLKDSLLKVHSPHEEWMDIYKDQRRDSMKKFTLIVVIVVVLFAIGIFTTILTGCNKQLIDVTYKFDEAIISLPNGEIVEGKVDSWKDYEGDQIQVKIKGKTYLVHSSNVALIA